MHAHSAKRADDQKHADPVTGTPAIHDYTPKELRKLSRSELLEVMIAQADQIERLQAELAQVRDELAQKSIAIDEAGSIAEAALRLNGVFEAAQKAADEYVAAVAKKCAGGGRFMDGFMSTSEAAPATGHGVEQNTVDKANTTAFSDAISVSVDPYSSPSGELAKDGSMEPSIDGSTQSGSDSVSRRVGSHFAHPESASLPAEDSAGERDVRG